MSNKSREILQKKLNTNNRADECFPAALVMLFRHNKVWNKAFLIWILFLYYDDSGYFFGRNHNLIRLPCIPILRFSISGYFFCWNLLSHQASLYPDFLFLQFKILFSFEFPVCDADAVSCFPFRHFRILLLLFSECSSVQCFEIFPLFCISGQFLLAERSKRNL